MEFPLSAEVTIASLFCILVMICFMVLYSDRADLFIFLSCFSCSRFSATLFLKYSLSVCGREFMAVSASNARVVNQFLFLLCRLYFRPFSNKAISLFVKAMPVLFTPLW